MDPTVLVTGANGYTGSQFCRYLARKRIPTRGMYWEPDGRPTANEEGIEFVPGDLRDRDSLKRALQGIETVYNIAALYRPANVSKSVFWHVNVEGVRNIMKAAAEAGVRSFVQCSTIGVHGHVEEPPANEGAPIKPDDYYQYTKLKGEELAKQLGPELGFRFSIVRPAAIYGPLETRFLKLAKLVARGKFIMFGNGEVLYHFIHIDDLCNAFVLCADRDEASGQTYIIADEGAITLNQIVSIVAQAAGSPCPARRLPLFVLNWASVACEFGCKPFGISPPLHRRRASWFQHTRSFDITKARQEIGFQPKITPEVGLPQMVQSFREAGWLA